MYVVIVLLNLIVSKIYLSISYLIPLGFKVYGFSVLDYESLIPMGKFFLNQTFEYNVSVYNL